MQINTAIVGAKHHAGAGQKLMDTPDGASVELVREPDNPFDANAVACHIDGVKCGFVPSAQAERLAADLDAGRTVTATLRGYNKLDVEIEDDEQDERAAS